VANGISKQVYRHNSQEVCPWNLKFAEGSTELGYAARSGSDGPALVELMGLSDGEFSARFSGSSIKRAKRRGFFSGSSIKRAKRRGFLRNFAVALQKWFFSRPV